MFVTSCWLSRENLVQFRRSCPWAAGTLRRWASVLISFNRIQGMLKNSLYLSQRVADILQCLWSAPPPSPQKINTHSDIVFAVIGETCGNGTYFDEKLRIKSEFSNSPTTHWKFDSLCNFPSPPPSSPPKWEYLPTPPHPTSKDKSDSSSFILRSFSCTQIPHWKWQRHTVDLHYISIIL